MRTFFFNTLAIACLAFSLSACKKEETTAPPPQSETQPASANAPTLDCFEGNPICPQIIIAGDSDSRLPNGELSPFRGFADPTIRQDPQSGRIWMAYSWPNVHVLGPLEVVPGVDIHLAHSDDGGATWTYDGDLWSSYADTDRGGDGAPGFTDHEVANLLPIQNASGLTWIGARLDYFLPTSGGFKERPIGSFRLVLTQADTPQQLRDAPSVTLGSSLTSPGWGVDFYLSSLDASLNRCSLWNEPALFYENETLYLVVRCLAYSRTTSLPLMDQSDLVVFSARPVGDVKSWQWSYLGVLAGSNEARELGGDGLTQVDLAKGTDGALLAVITTDAWSNAERDFIHYGCLVVEVESLDPPALKRDGNGNLIVRAVATASDQLPLGPGACSYDPASATGVLIVRREKVEGYMVAGIFTTGLKP
ncbi:MAG: hypothetical protein HFACDABA_00982 [Anaerolineales bacterium]|nr:hypothetical protein [Anaerolineales bacterium]